MDMFWVICFEIDPFISEYMAEMAVVHQSYVGDKEPQRLPLFAVKQSHAINSKVAPVACLHLRVFGRLFSFAFCCFCQMQMDVATSTRYGCLFYLQSLKGLSFLDLLKPGLGSFGRQAFLITEDYLRRNETIGDQASDGSGTWRLALDRWQQEWKGST